MRKLIFVAILFVFTHCEKFAMDRKYSLYLKNNTNHAIVYMIGENIYLIPTVYPDTTLGDHSWPIDHTTTIEPNINKDLFGGSVKISDIVKDLPADTLSIYIFHIDTLENNTWAEVQAGYKMKRYDLSLEDLEYLDYKLSYPPDAKMSGVKMYPPYP